jgi:threonine/homoserine/homoserine lactone efflux protein
MHSAASWLFVASAAALLGSPGPGIAALLAVGLVSLLAAFPFALRAMTVVSADYLLYLAYQVAAAPVGWYGCSSGCGCGEPDCVPEPSAF